MCQCSAGGGCTGSSTGALAAVAPKVLDSVCVLRHRQAPWLRGILLLEALAVLKTNWTKQRKTFNLEIFICRRVSCENINLLIYKTLPAVSTLMVHKAVSCCALFFQRNQKILGNILFLFKAQH